MTACLPSNICGCASGDCGEGEACCGGVCQIGVWANQTTFGGVGPGPGQFNIPRGVAVAPDGLTVWVADTINHRVSVWGLVCPA